jgi:hypothetical protein
VRISQKLAKEERALGRATRLCGLRTAGYLMGTVTIPNTWRGLATDSLPCQRDRRRYLTRRARPASSTDQHTQSTSTPTTRGGVETAVHGAKLSGSSQSKGPGARQGGGQGVAGSGARRRVHGATTAPARSTARLAAWQRASPPPSEPRSRREPASGTRGRRGRSPARLGRCARPPRPGLPGRTAVPRRPPPFSRRPPPAARRFHTNPGGRRGGGGEDGRGTCPHPGQRQRGAPPNSRLRGPARVRPVGRVRVGEGRFQGRAGRRGGGGPAGRVPAGGGGTPGGKTSCACARSGGYQEAGRGEEGRGGAGGAGWGGVGKGLHSGVGNRRCAPLPLGSCGSWASVNVLAR